jgi:hypothetical protein
MRRIIFLLIALLFTTHTLTAQPAKDSAYLLLLNQQIDDHVVQRNVAALDTLFATDFVFNHGSGKTEGKAGWMATVVKANYPLRRHDSVTVELHPGVAVVKGKMNIQKINKDKTDRYWLKYVRLYAWRITGWKLISHSTVQEKHEL